MTPKERETLEDDERWHRRRSVKGHRFVGEGVTAVHLAIADAIRAALRETRETRLPDCPDCGAQILGYTKNGVEGAVCRGCGREFFEKSPAALSTPTGEAGALREALRDLAGTIVAICDSGNTNLAHLACMDNSQLVDECRSILAVMAGAEPHTAKEAALAAALAAPVPAALAAPVPAAPPDLVAQRDRLQMTLMRLVGVSTRTELEEMEAVIRSLPGIDEDKSAALDAIHALLAYPLPPKEPTR